MKQVLYCGPDYEAFDALVRAMGYPTRLGEGLHIGHERAQICFRPAFTQAAVWAALEEDYVNLLVIDLRGAPDSAHTARRVEQMRRLLRSLDDVDNLEARYAFHRILVLVDGEDAERNDRLLVELGGHGIRHVLSQRDGVGAAAFARRVLERALELMLDRAPALSAVCAAGGGITGIYFELGALKCLDDCLPPGSLHRFDMYFGISAGAVVMSVIANGYSPDEFMAALVGAEGGRVPPLNLSLLRLGHLNLGDMGRRLGYLTRKTLRSMTQAAQGRAKPSLDAVFLELTSLVGPPFRSDHFEELLREVLTQPGACNDFRQLKRALFIGASNQDSREHMLFGAQSRHTPISRAVQASLSINPAFSGVEIDGAWYEDGAVTRTSNFSEAIRRGANLIFVLDPFVPYVSKTPGFANRRGLLFNIDQDIRALSYTRYENARNWVLRRHPEVSAYTFLPNNRLRRLLSANPMDHRPSLEIFKGAYLATLNRLRTVEPRLRGDLKVHGMDLRLDKACAVADRLTAADPPTFADFFVGGRIEIRRPPLTLE